MAVLQILENWKARSMMESILVKLLPTMLLQNALHYFSIKFSEVAVQRRLRKRCSENMQQIYRRTSMPKCDFSKVAKQLYWNSTSVWMFSCKFASYFQNTLSKEPLRHGCSPVNLLHIFRTCFLTNTSGGLLLSLVKLQDEFLPKVDLTTDISKENLLDWGLEFVRDGTPLKGFWRELSENVDCNLTETQEKFFSLEFS